jgi:hypothetical protein
MHLLQTMLRHVRCSMACHVPVFVGTRLALHSSLLFTGAGVANLFDAEKRLCKCTQTVKFVP